MGRLIEQDNKGLWKLKGVSWESLSEGKVITKDIREKLYGALCKLKDYEDTGLSPEDVKMSEYALTDAAEELEECYGMKTNLVGEIEALLKKF